MRKNWKNNLLLSLVFLLLLVLNGCKENHNHEAGTNGEVIYTCPMHPQIVRSEPGSCPICGMNLVPKQTSAAPAAAIPTDLNYLLEPVNQTVISSVTTIQPIQKRVQNEIVMSGIVTYDTRRQYTIPARFGGRIEKVYVQFNYQPVRKGQKLYDIYSPELITVQKELLYLLQIDAGNISLLNGAKQKLRLLGATEAQINHLIRTGRESYTFTVYSPYNGYVLDPAVNAVPPAAAPPVANAGSAGMGGMGGANAASAPSSGSTGNPAPGGGFAIREGMYVTAGQALLKVVDASQVWAQFRVSSNQAAQVTQGMPIAITFNQLPDANITSKVSLVEPAFEAGEDFVRVRAALPAQSNLTAIGQLLTGKITYRTGQALWVPKAAVLDIGTQSIVFLKVNGIFKPISIREGQRVEEQVEVLAGLKAEDVIASNAQFLVDSESFIRVEELNR